MTLQTEIWGEMFNMVHWQNDIIKEETQAAY